MSTILLPKKGGKLPKPTLQNLAILEQLEKEVEIKRSIERRVNKKFKEDRHFAQVMVALEKRIQSNTISKQEKDDIRQLLSDPKLENDADVQLLRDEVYLDVEQHYLDFLNRKPDPTSLAFWSNQLPEPGQVISSHDIDSLVNISSAFFLSTEFYDSGFLIYRMYKAAFGDATGVSTVGGTHTLAVPVVRLSEFVPSLRQIGQGVIVGKDGWQTILESNKQRFMMEFASRSRFAFTHPTSMSPAQFVDRLIANAGGTSTRANRTATINLFGGASTTTNLTARAQAWRSVAESSALASQEFNRAFVLMLYFGYLQRNPDDLPDSDFSGYDFWLRKLNQFNGDHIRAELVKAFITSDEYRKRFPR